LCRGTEEASVCHDRGFSLRVPCVAEPGMLDDYYALLEGFNCAAAGSARALT
jgi:hypothetical protein